MTKEKQHSIIAHIIVALLIATVVLAVVVKPEDRPETSQQAEASNG